MRTIFRLKGVSDESTLNLVTHCRGLTLNDEVEPVEIVAARCEDAARILLKVLRLALVGSGTEVQRPVEPDAKQWGDVRPSVWTNCC